jgi:hypothetical protein
MILMYTLNCIVAGVISVISLWSPLLAQRVIFENTVQYSEAIRLVGALWFAIFALSLVGLLYPKDMQVVFLVQIIYKATWLSVVAAPALYYGSAFPKSMALFFVIWVILLPFVIDWSTLLKH